MGLKFNTSQLEVLSRKLAGAGREFGRPEMSRAMKKALRPMLSAARSAAPVSRKSIIGHGVLTSKSGKTRRDGTYDKGGALRRDMRIRIVEGQGSEYLRGLVGVDKRRGHVGWRAVFVTRGTVARRTRKGYNRGSNRANYFLDRAERVGMPLAISSLGNDARAIVENIVRRIR